MIRTSLLLSSTLVLLSGCVPASRALARDFPTSTPAQERRQLTGRALGRTRHRRTARIGANLPSKCLGCRWTPTPGRWISMPTSAASAPARAVSLILPCSSAVVKSPSPAASTAKTPDRRLQLPHAQGQRRCSLLWPERPEIEQIRIPPTLLRTLVGASAGGDVSVAARAAARAAVIRGHEGERARRSRSNAGCWLCVPSCPPPRALAKLNPACNTAPCRWNGQCCRALQWTSGTRSREIFSIPCLRVTST